MPLPAILAGLARIGATLASRAGAASAARSLAGMATTAGRSVAARAATKSAASAAASRGASAAATAAASPSAGTVGAGGFRVLENTRLGDARSLFQAIYGQTPPAGAASASKAATSAAATAGSETAQGAAAAQVQAAAAASEQAAANAAKGSAAAAAPAATPGPSPGASPSPGSTPASNPKPQTLLDRAVDVFHRSKQRAEAMQARFEPVAERVKNLSMDERYDRLKGSGKLLDPSIVGRAAGTPNPSRDQVIQHSEAEEERQRQDAIQQSRSAQVGQAAWSAGKRAIAGAMTFATPGTAATGLPLAMYSAISGFERLGRTLAETNRDLSRFDERIADSFARLDFQQLRSRQSMAQATSGSSAFLNEQLAQLVREMQPLRESVTSFLNLAGGSIVYTARILAMLLKWHPTMIAVRGTAELAERMLGRREAEVAQKASKDFLAAIRDGSFRLPRAPGPGGK